MIARSAVLALLGSLLLVPASTAAADPPGCQGEWPTIVGSPGARLRGTDGPDVILSRGAVSIEGGDGDDRICLTGDTPGHRTAHVSVGRGDNRVVSHLAPGTRTVVRLGRDGNDTFLGGPGTDFVIGGLTGRDVVRTGSGPDKLRAVVKGPMDDRINLGAGDDRIEYKTDGLSEGAELDGGGGRDHLTVYSDSVGAPLVVDNASGTLTADGVSQMQWEHFETLVVEADWDSSVDLVGGDGGDRFLIYHQSVTSARLGGGDDYLRFFVDRLPTGFDAAFDGGAGIDRLDTLTEGSASVDLAADVARFSEGGVTLQVPGFEGASVTAQPVTLVGDASPNQLTAFGCDTEIRGGGGADVLRLAYSLGFPFECSTWTTLLRGDSGDDLLLGNARDDLLYGGPGFDEARAGDGRDLCRSIERKESCERS